MENTTGAFEPTALDSTIRPRPRTAVDWIGRVALVLVVLVVGAFVGVVVPLLAIACDTCQDGVRGPLRFGDALVAVAYYGVPLTMLGTVAGILHPRGGGRAGGIGLGVLVLLMIVMLVLGQATA